MTAVHRAEPHFHPGVPLKDRVKLEEDSLEARVGEFLESRIAELLIVLLVLIDLCAVTIEAGIDHQFLCIGGQVESRNPAKHLFLQVRQFQLHPDAGHSPAGHHKVLVCETPEGHHAHHVLHACHVISITILCIFMIELLLKIWVHGEEFFQSSFEVMDLVVVSLSLFCDLYIAHLLESQRDSQFPAEALEILLITMRLWRVVRIVHGVYEIKFMEDRRVELKLEEKDAKIHKLGEALKAKGVSVEDL